MVSLILSVFRRLEKRKEPQFGRKPLKSTKISHFLPFRLEIRSFLP